MEHELHKKTGLYEDWCDTPVPHNTNYEIVDIIEFRVLDKDTNEIYSKWENPKYKNGDN